MPPWEPQVWLCHLSVSLAKLLIVTEDKPDARYAVLRGNALRLFATAGAGQSEL